jgi:DNA-binding beta-propeller fold protein YncE
MIHSIAKPEFRRGTSPQSVSVSPARRALRLTLACLAAAVPASALRAQTFVAEWAEADIGRIGPTGLALDTIGGVTYLYVSDQNNGRVLKFNLSTGKRVAIWGKTGTEDGEFNSPFGIAIDPVSHDLYVAERSNNRIQRITNNGAFVMKWGVGGTGPNELWGPIGVAADAAGNVYVTDGNNHRVVKYHVQSAGTGWDVQVVKTWGGHGAAEGQFDKPFGITLDASGTLWVADSFNHRIQKFDTSGKFLGAIGTFGTGNGQFVTPTWVNFDSAGAFYVAETNSDPQNLKATDIQNQRIQKFDAAGRFVMKWGSYGEDGGQFKLPFDVVIDGGNAYVSDYYNTRLQKFSLSAAPQPPPTAAATARFVNLSSRLRTIDGNTSRAFIAGFVVSGSSPKPMLVRAVGPSLSQFGISGMLANPRLQIFSGTQMVAENDDWSDTPTMRATWDRVGAFALNAGSRDAAVVVTLAPGSYSAHVLANGGDGVALVEVYDAEAAQPATQLINLSTRGFVDTGDGVLVAGFAVTGDTPKRVLVRGVGPALAGFNVSGPLPDPVLKVFSGTTVLAQNDDWETPQAVAGAPAPAGGAEIATVSTGAGAFTLPPGSKDAALLITLPAGSYSAVVSGAGGATGAALVEVYEVTSR